MLKFAIMTCASIALNCAFVYVKPWAALLSGGLFAMALSIPNN
jgi:hypothetical protein